MTDRRLEPGDAVFAGVIIAAILLSAWAIAYAERDVRQCAGRGGHMKTVATIWNGHSFVPVRKCVDTRPK